MNDFWFGVLVTVVCAIIPFVISSYQLSQETKKLRKLINLIIRGIEESGFATYRRDKKGEIMGMVFSESISEGFSISAKTEANVSEE